MPRFVLIVAGVAVALVSVLLALSPGDDAETAGARSAQEAGDYPAAGVSGGCPDPSPTGCDVPTNTPLPTPTPTIPLCDSGHFPNATLCPTVEATWGDNNCSDAVDPVDSLIALRSDAGLPANTGGCPQMGADIDVLSGSPHKWGDIDCSGSAPDPVDALKLLRFDAGLSVQQDSGCIDLGSEVWLAITTPHYLSVQVGVLVDGDDEDGSFTNDEFVSPGSTATYLVTIDNDSSVPAAVASVTDDVYGEVTCATVGQGNANIIGLIVGADDGDGDGLDGGIDELQCTFEGTAPGTSDTIVVNTTTASIGNGSSATDSDTAQITVQ